MYTTLNFITWSVSPEIFTLGSFSVRWYGVLLASGFFFAYLTLSKVFKTEKLSQQLLDKLTIWCIVWTVVGLRLAHFLFYEPHYLFQHPLQVLLPVDENWNFIGYQGLASHGAVIALILFLSYFAWKHKMNVLWLLDRLCIVIPVAAAMVRLGNLMNHEIVGSITTVPWAFNFTHGGYGVADTLRHPAQLYESLVYFSLYIFMLIYYFKITKGNIPAGRAVGTLLTVIFTARFFIEFVKEVQVSSEIGMTLNIGQRLSIPFIIIGLGLLIYSFIQKNKIPHYIEPHPKTSSK
ncbi:MAG: prolipoprotein diacylglyceryl transferase [Bacteroidetes bacterium]|nr:prolipoprotein diacylglyceryl transferase [Bacteroidota bacterium]MCL1968963.1 prolipoprotein diacylglyceryl transferase [Bacteroidota bacterium]